jgi:hypothetical protein
MTQALENLARKSAATLERVGLQYHSFHRPRPSGYRSLVLKIEHHALEVRSDILCMETELGTHLQHAALRTEEDWSR